LSRPKGWKKFAQERFSAPLVQSASIVGIGRVAQADYQQRFPSVPCYCIPYHCDLSAFLSIPRPQASSPVTFLFCGQMIRRKGVDLLLTAFDRMITKGFDAKLLLIGREADLPEFLHSVGSQALSRIHYEGFQAPERLAEYFAQAHVFVLPSRYDGWGVVINQALGAGMPVISSDAAGAGLDLVENNVNGMLIPSGNVDSLQHAMETIVRNTNLIREWGDNARRTARLLTPEAGAEKWLQVFMGTGP